jgi:hypothetical protein
MTKYERKNLVTPWLRLIAQITIWGVVKSAASAGAVLAAVGWAVWKGLVMKKWVEDVEYEGNVDADKALEDLDGGDEEKKKAEEKEKETKDEAGKKGKGKKK